MADLNKLRELIDIYGVAVRAGLVTPCKNDEKYFRTQIGFPDMPKEVEADWDDSDGVRRPITLQRPSMTEESLTPEAAAAAEASAKGEVKA